MQFVTKELRKLGITTLHLITSRVAMVCKEISSSALCGHVDQSPESIRRMLQAFRTVNRMKVEYCAGIRLLCPRQEAVCIPFDQTHRSVNQLDFVFAKI